jgi:hypothetical protein
MTKKTVQPKVDEVADVQITEKPNTEIIKSEEMDIADPGPDWSKIKKLQLDSLQARWGAVERWSILRELFSARVEMVLFYMKPEGGNLDMEEAIKRADKELTPENFKRRIADIGKFNLAGVSWFTLYDIFKSDPSSAQDIWEDIKYEAEKDFKAGHFAASLFERTDWQKSPWKRAQFIAIWQGMVEQYQPQGAIDYTMIDVLAVNYFLWMHWTEEHLKRATTEPRRESHDYIEWKRMMEGSEPKTRRQRRQESQGNWDIPYQKEAEAIEQAAQLADRFRRAYQSQLRAMRDWRRYNVPLTINNPQQVNIAADGGQQLNLQESTTRNKREDKEVDSELPLLNS